MHQDMNSPQNDLKSDRKFFDAGKAAEDDKKPIDTEEAEKNVIKAKIALEGTLQENLQAKRLEQDA